MKGYRKVLIAVNGSMKVLADGLKLASDERCWVTVVKVLPPNDGDLNLTGIKNIEDVLSGGAESSLSEIQKTAIEERALIKTMLLEGEPHIKILEAAEEERCDVIVMGRQKGGILRKLFGDNVVEKVIGQAPCPVLVV